MRVGVGRWWAKRRLVAALAILVASITGTGMAVLGGAGSYLQGGVIYTLASAVALAYPPAIVLQVIAGQGLAASILLNPGAPSPILLLPAVVGVVATAELLALSARLGSPVERSPAPDLGRALAATAIGAAVFASVLVAGALPGPTGIVAVTLASAALVGVAMVLVGRAGQGPSDPPGWTTTHRAGDSP